MEVKVGDRVLHAKYAGSEFKLDSEDYPIVSEKDLLAIVEGGSEAVAAVARRLAARLGRLAKPPAGRASDSDMTATGTNDGVRRRTVKGAKRGNLYTRRTSANVGGRKKPG